MGKKIILFLGIFLLFSMVLINAQAQPPLEGAQGFPTGLFVEIIQTNTHENNKDLIFNAHVFNITDGVRRTNLTTDCNLHVFDNTGFHIVNQERMPYDDVGLDWDLTIDKGSFTRNGGYSALIVCNSTDNFGGFIAWSFDVTQSGLSVTMGQGLLYLGFFIMLIFTFLVVLFSINQLPSTNTKDEEGVILSISYLKYLRPVGWMFEYMLIVAILFLSSNIAFAFLNEQLFAKILFTLFIITFSLAPVIITVWIIWIYRQMFHDKEMQNLLNRGFFSEGKI